MRMLLSRAVATLSLALGPPAAVAMQAIGTGSHVTGTAPAALPGREDDLRVAEAVWRLATAGRARCPRLEPAFGVVWQHLSQFNLPDRAGLVATQALDRGPAAVAVVPDGPGARAGLLPGDVLLAIDGAPLPPEPGLAEPFDQGRAQARVDLVEERLAAAGTGPAAFTLWRHGGRIVLNVAAQAACPASVRLARSAQTNGFADGRHIFLTTGLLARLHSPDELAFVVAHEMAHTILGHPALLQAQGVGHGLADAIGSTGALVRQTEREADRLGGELMLDAGFDPVAGVQVLARLGGLPLGIALFATHDSARQRIAAMRALVAARRRR